jgi:hypothetical protein
MAVSTAGDIALGPLVAPERGAAGNAGHVGQALQRAPPLRGALEVANPVFSQLPGEF